MSTSMSYACPAYLAARIAELNPPKSIEQISRDAGFEKPTTLPAVLAGEVALPLKRSFDLARAIRCDRAEVFRLAMRDHGLEKTLLPMIEALDEFKVTEEELHLLSLLRRRLAGRDLIINDVVEEWVETFPVEAC